MSTIAVKKPFFVPGSIPLPYVNKAIFIGVMYATFEILTRIGVWLEL
jgi:hypothetical protein